MYEWLHIGRLLWGMLQVVSTCMQKSMSSRLPVQMLRKKRDNPTTALRNRKTIPHDHEIDPCNWDLVNFSGAFCYSSSFLSCNQKETAFTMSDEKLSD